VHRLCADTVGEQQPDERIHLLFTAATNRWACPWRRCSMNGSFDT
jgi:hypothetical protein